MNSTETVPTEHFVTIYSPQSLDDTQPPIWAGVHFFYRYVTGRGSQMVNTLQLSAPHPVNC